jgi:hypothetical protein
MGRNHTSERPSPRGRIAGAFVPSDLLYLLLAAVCLWSLAYQLPLEQRLHIGGDVALERREDDGPFLEGVNGSEPAERVDDAGDPRGYVWWFEEARRKGIIPYRWTTADSAVVVPGAGGGPYLVEIVAGSGRPDNSEAPTLWTPGTAPPVELSLPAEPRRYRLLAPAGPGGELRVTMRTTPFTPPGDPRELGFVLHEVRLRDIGAAPRAPAWPALGWLALAVGVIYGLASALHVGRTWSLALAAGAALAAAGALALARPALTVFAPELGLLAVACAALGAAAWPLVRRIAPSEAARAEAGHVLALVLLAFALRMGGMLHPQALFSDLGLHANKLYEVTLGRVFFTTGLPGDVGGGQQPYPPGGYLMMLPGQLVAAGGEARRLLVQGATALFDSLAVALIWALLRRAGLGTRAAALGAACYLLPTAALESFSIGEYANLAGQALALPLIALLGLGALSRPETRSPIPDPRSPISSPRSLLTAAVALGLLAHSGVTLSVGALVAAAWAFAWAGRLRGRDGAVDPVVLSIGAAAGLVVALLIYYTAPVFLGALADRAGRAGQGAPALKVLGDTLRALLGLTPPQDTRAALPPLLGPAAVAGLVLVLLRRKPNAAPLRALLAAWWAGTALTLALLLVAEQGVRWAIFLYPALCLGAGICLDALWRRGRLGRLAAIAALAIIVGAGLVAWIGLIRDFKHI